MLALAIVQHDINMHHTHAHSNYIHLTPGCYEYSLLGGYIVKLQALSLQQMYTNKIKISRYKNNTYAQHISRWIQGAENRPYKRYVCSKLKPQYFELHASSKRLSNLIVNLSATWSKSTV